jgi:hypothetical protein
MPLCLWCPGGPGGGWLRHWASLSGLSVRRRALQVAWDAGFAIWFEDTTDDAVCQTGALNRATEARAPGLDQDRRPQGTRLEQVYTEAGQSHGLDLPPHSPHPLPRVVGRALCCAGRGLRPQTPHFPHFSSTTFLGALSLSFATAQKEKNTGRGVGCCGNGENGERTLLDRLGRGRGPSPLGWGSAGENGGRWGAPTSRCAVAKRVLPCPRPCCRVFWWGRWVV